MITEDKVAEIFCMADDFCKFFDAMTAKYTLKPTGKRKYHRNSTMLKAEVILIMILFHDSGYRCFIETVNDELKNISQVEHSIHRYFDRFIINLLQAITTYFQRSVHQCTKHHLHSPYIVLNSSNSRYLLCVESCGEPIVIFIWLLIFSALMCCLYSFGVRCISLKNCS